MPSAPFYTFARAWVQSNMARMTTAKIKATTIALGIGCIIAILVMFGRGVNGGQAFQNLFTDAFHPIKLNSTLVIISIFIIVGIANAVAFKAGLFNIGVSGQMFFAAVIGIIFGVQIIPSTGVVGVLLLIVICMIVGALIAALAGLLKALFNIHEVVATILLNWALFFFGRWLLFQVPGLVVDNGQSGTRALTNDMAFLFQVPNASYIVFGCFGVLFALVIAFVFWKTTFGFKAKAVGLSPEAADYAGINRRRRVVLAMGLSGLAAGLAGAVAFLLVDRNIASNFFIADALPAWGFDGIAIALLAFNNPIGVIPIAVFLGVIKSGATSLSLIGLDSQVYDLVLGIIMYLSAIAVLFIRFRIGQMLWTYYHLQVDPELRQAKLTFLLQAPTWRGFIYARLITKSKWAQQLMGRYRVQFDADYLARKQELIHLSSARLGVPLSPRAVQLSRWRAGRNVYARYLVHRLPERLTTLSEINLSTTSDTPKGARAARQQAYRRWKSAQRASMVKQLQAIQGQRAPERTRVRAFYHARVAALIQARLVLAQPTAATVTFVAVMRLNLRKAILYWPYRWRWVSKVVFYFQLWRDERAHAQRTAFRAARRATRTTRASRTQAARTAIWFKLWQKRQSLAWKALNAQFKNDKQALRANHHYAPYGWLLSHYHWLLEHSARLLHRQYVAVDHYRAYQRAVRALASQRQGARRQLSWAQLTPNQEGRAHKTLREQFRADRHRFYNQLVKQGLEKMQPFFAAREHYRQTRRQELSRLTARYFQLTSRYDVLVHHPKHERALERYRKSPRGYARRAAYQKIVAQLLSRDGGQK